MLGLRRRYWVVGTIMAVAILAFVGTRLLSAAYLVGGPDVARIIRHADRAEAFSLHHDLYFDKLSDIPAVGEGVVLSPDVREEMASLLLSWSSYNHDGWARMCAPIWGAKVRFTQGNESVDVYFCFQCMEMQFVKEGQRRTSAYFDPSAMRFAELFAATFPKDHNWQMLAREFRWDQAIGKGHYSSMVEEDKQAMEVALIPTNQEVESKSVESDRFKKFWQGYLRENDPPELTSRDLPPDALSFRLVASEPGSTILIDVSPDDDLWQIQMPGTNWVTFELAAARPIFLELLGEVFPENPKVQQWLAGLPVKTPDNKPVETPVPKATAP